MKEGFTNIKFKNWKVFRPIKNLAKFKNCALTIGSLILGLNSVSAQTPCTPTYSIGCSSNDRITNVSLEGESITLDNSTQCSAGGYGDYTSMDAPDLAPGSTYEISVSTDYIVPGSEDVRIWIDYNGDGVFDSSEEIGNSNGNGMGTGTVTYNFTVPVNVNPGTYTMRVRLVYSGGANIDPCASASYGETEDYSVEIITLNDCTGTPDAGTVTNLETCPDVDLLLNASGGSAPASGFDRLWQRSPAGQNDWVDIPNSNNNNFWLIGGINEDTDFRFILTCTFSNESDTSDVLEATLSNFTECFCEPTYNYGCSNGSRINGVITTLGLSNINNTNTACEDLTSQGFSDYSSSHSASSMKASLMDIEVQVSNYSGGVKVWIDYNQNGIFDADELVTESSASITSGSSHNATFIVPANAVSGTTKMRVRVVENSTNFDPCSDYNYGETEDYEFVIIEGNPCAGTPSLDPLIGPSSICPSTSFSVQIPGIPEEGITYQWQESPSGANTWSDVAGETNVLYTISDGITDPMDYRVVVTCNNSNLSDTSDVHTVSISPVTECYCEPIYTYGDYTSAFSTSNALENVSFTASAVYDYENLADTDTIEIMAGTSFDISHTYVGGANTIAIWVDWNQDGILDNTAEKIFESYSTAASQNGTIDIPTTTVPGDYRLRLRSSYSTTVPQPCNSVSYGSALDYTLRVIPMPDCSTVSTPSDWELITSLDTICVEDDINLKVEPLIIADGVTYQFQSSTNGVNWTDLGSANNTGLESMNDVNQNTYFRVLWLCDGVVVDNTDPVFVPVVNPEILTTTDGYVCGEGTVDLHATSSPGSNVVWYENPTGGNPIHQGDNFTTPVLNSTTSYWVGAGLGSSADPDEFVGSGNYTITGTPNPFYTTYWGSKNQFLIKESELTALGYSAGSIQEVIFDVAANSGMDLDNFEIKIGQTTLNDLTATFQTGLTTVYTASGPTVLGAIGEKVFELDNPFYWDGTSNLIIETCFNNNSWSGGNSVVGTQSLGFTASTYQYADNANVCSQTGGYTSQNRPNIKLKIDMGCLSDLEEVQAIVYPELELNIDDTIRACMGDTVTLDVGAGFESYLWDNNSTEHYIDVTSPGSYTVIVENLGCVKEKTIVVEYYDYPVVDLGEDIYSCFGDTLILDAGNPGMHYQWNTGDTTRMIQVYNGGVYTVEVSNGVCATEDEVEVFLQEVASGWAIDNYDLGNRLFEFSVVDPIEVTDYLWDFGDGSPQSDLEFPTHQYAADGVYTVTVALNSQGCGPGDTLMRHVIVRTVGVDELNDNQTLSIYPNPARDYVNIELDNSSKIDKIALQDAKGRVMEIVELEKQGVNAYRMNTGHLPSGVYMILIQTKEGLHTRTLELIK